MESIKKCYYVIFMIGMLFGTLSLVSMESKGSSGKFFYFKCMLLNEPTNSVLYYIGSGLMGYASRPIVWSLKHYYGDHPFSNILIELGSFGVHTGLTYMIAAYNSRYTLATQGSKRIITNSSDFDFTEGHHKKDLFFRLGLGSLGYIAGIQIHKEPHHLWNTARQ